MKQRHVLHDGTILAFDSYGSGNPLIVVHGGMGIDSAYLRCEGVLELAGPARRVVIYDQRGHGASGRSDPKAYSHSQWAADLRELASHLNEGPIDVLGHSYGAFIALEFASTYPSMLDRLILVGGSAGPVIRRVPTLRSDEQVRAAFRVRWPQMFGSQVAPWDVFERCTFAFESFNAAFGRELPKYDLRTHVEQIKAPTLLIVGEVDGYRADMSWLAAKLPNARLEVIAGAGHMPFLERPREFHGLIRAFLGGDRST